jgi:hydroxysqualene synthase
VVSAGAATVSPAVVRRAYAACTQLARSHYENFPVASLLLPRRMRPAIAAVYAFARRADDFADEPGYARQERLRLLDDWQRRLDAAAAGMVTAGDADDLIFVAVADAIREHELPPSLFSDLLSAFRQDVNTTRYERWDDVLDYCRRSANPVGRLVLRIAGYRDDALDRSSDALCTALQLTNFWQDFARDWQNGRLYVPRADYESFGARAEDLEAVIAYTGATPELSAAPLPAEWRATLREMVRRTHQLFSEGRLVCERVSGRLRYELRFTWHGGARILERIERSDFDILHRPALGPGDAASILWRTARWTGA